MPELIPSDTQAVLGENAARCDSRSLYMDRFAQPGAAEEERRSWFSRSIAKRAATPPPRPDITCGCDAPPLYAQLQSRLMVNMAGGVMENAGMCLDRFGLPYIPGSAVKGCARRAAIQSLIERRDAGASAAELGELLARIALVFGWGEGEWKVELNDSRRLKSDFVYAIGTELWTQVSLAAQQQLPKTDHFAGGVSFLPAHPVDVFAKELPLDIPPLGKLELDVLTSHHQKYYGRKESPGRTLVMPVALDIEDPIPVIFPAVAAGHVFKFQVLPLRGSSSALTAARQWLAEGLAIFGLGAKTAAGYGWFDTSDEVNSCVSIALKLAAIERQNNIERDAREKAEQEARENAIKAKQQEEKILGSLTPEAQEDFKIAKLSDDQFRDKLNKFSKLTEQEEKKAIIRALRLEPGAPGSRRAFWDGIKNAGKKTTAMVEAIRAFSYTMFPGKTGKMP